MSLSDAAPRVQTRATQRREMFLAWKTARVTNGPHYPVAPVKPLGVLWTGTSGLKLLLQRAKKRVYNRTTTELLVFSCMLFFN